MEGGQLVPWNLLSSHLMGVILFGEVYQMVGHIPSKPLILRLSHGAMRAEEGEEFPLGQMDLRTGSHSPAWPLATNPYLAENTCCQESGFLCQWTHEALLGYKSKSI